MNSIKYCSNASKAFVRTGMVLPKNFRFKFLSFLIISFVFLVAEHQGKIEIFLKVVKPLERWLILFHRI